MTVKQWERKINPEGCGPFVEKPDEGRCTPPTEFVELRRRYADGCWVVSVNNTVRHYADDQAVFPKHASKAALDDATNRAYDLELPLVVTHFE